MAKHNVKHEYKELVKMFNKLTGSRSLWQVFNDCIEMFALSIQNSFKIGTEYEKNEIRYKQIASQYKKEEVFVIAEIFAEIVNMATENPFRDLLGDLYMQLNMGSDALGQFFTPYHLAELMVEFEMNLDEVQELMSANEYITISEPACGGGANVIAFCKFLHDNDINYQNHCVIVCQDISRLTAMMCYVVLSLIGCSAVVKVGDTLANPYTNYLTELKNKSELWITPMFHLNNCYGKV